MSLTLADVAHVSRLARVWLSDEEQEAMQAQLSAILDYMEMLQDIDLEGVEPTAQITGLTSVMRPDEVQPSLSREDVLLNAPDYQGSMFRVKAVFDE
jgi:aspartyl-tRNA(Asn)/glutamyl-tRNA(Gln) amidotransferase subunit C